MDPSAAPAASPSDVSSPADSVSDAGYYTPKEADWLRSVRGSQTPGGGVCAEVLVRESDPDWRAPDIQSPGIVFGAVHLDNRRLPFPPLVAWCRAPQTLGPPQSSKPRADLSIPRTAGAQPLSLLIDFQAIPTKWFPASLCPRVVLDPNLVALPSGEVNPAMPPLHNAACPIEITAPSWISLLVDAIRTGATLPVDPDTGRSLLDVLIATRMNVPYGGVLSARVRYFAAYLAHQGQPIDLHNAARLHRLRARPAAPVVFAPVLDALVDQTLLRAGSVPDVSDRASGSVSEAPPTPGVERPSASPSRHQPISHRKM